MTSVKENRSVLNACAILTAIADDQPVGVSDLARRTGIDKSAVHRIAVTLHRAGWLESTGDGRWTIASALAAVITRSSRETLIANVRPTLDHLRDSTGETAMLVVIEHGRLRVLGVAESRHNLRISSSPGAELPLRHSSASRAIAAHLPPDELAVLRQADPSLDDGTLAETRARGWAINDREIVPDARVVGAPILSAEGYPLAALIVCAPTSRIDLAAISDMGALVAQAARQMSGSG